MKVHAVCVYNSREYCAVVCIYKYRSAWAGFTLLILIKGQCEGLTVGISADGYILPRLFCFHNLCGNRLTDWFHNHEPLTVNPEPIM